VGAESRLSVRRNLSPLSKGKDSDLDAFVSEDGSEPEPGLHISRGKEVKLGGFCRVLFPPSPIGRRSCLLLDVELDAWRK